MITTRTVHIENGKVHTMLHSLASELGTLEPSRRGPGDLVDRARKCAEVLQHKIPTKPGERGPVVTKADLVKALEESGPLIDEILKEIEAYAVESNTHYFGRNRADLKVWGFWPKEDRE